MKQTASVISTYTADVSGVCSALYELGGMTIMHDPSGCNSTYNTHDEPRWYDMDSMIYISALSEMEAIMGDDDKLISDIVDAAKSLSPAFITIAGTIVPTMIGTDLHALATIVGKRTGIPTFFLPTNSMKSYISGAGMALEMLAKHMVTEPDMKKAGTSDSKTDSSLSVNLLGVTPVDFSVNGSSESLKQVFTENGMRVISCWAMGSSLADIQNAAAADVNVVVSCSGLPAAMELQRRFGTPYVIGQPIGDAMTGKLLDDVRHAADGSCQVTYLELEASQDQQNELSSDDYDITIIGECVTSKSLAAALHADSGKRIQVLCPLEPEEALLGADAFAARDEVEIIPHLAHTRMVIADPLYKPICPAGCEFVSLPHEGFSGRIFRRDIPDLIRNYDVFKADVLK